MVEGSANEFLRDGRAPIPEKPATSMVMRANKAKNSKPELLFRMALVRQQLRGYKLHLKNIPGRPDICFPDKKLAIFVNGCFWHRCPYCKPPLPKSHRAFWEKKFYENRARDKRKRTELNLSGWRVLTFWECQIKANALKYASRVSIELGE